MVQGLFLINPIYDVGNWFEMFQIRFLCLALRYRNRFIKNLFSKRFPSIRWNSSQSPPPPPPSSSSSFCSNSSSFSSSSSSTSLENVEDEAALVVTDINNLDDGNNNNNLIYNTNNDEDEDGDYDGSSNDSNSVPDDYYFDRENDNDCEEHGNYGDNLNRNGDASIKINQKDCKKIKKFRMENFLKFLHTYANRSPLSFGSNRYDPKQTLQCSTLIIVGDRSWNDLDSQRLQEKLRPGCYEFVRISKANFVWIDCPRTLAYLFQLFIQGFGLGVNLPLPIVYH
ncbi:hypothetical protein QR98_0053530 [Sarcoptes scabiei]|nr:hypothetical protein QR98_0053530 [Sarcoptes scabiei]